MKKKLLTLCSILLIIGCSKAEPQQEEELTVVKSSVTTESIEVAGASYNPNVQDGGELEESVITTPVDASNDSKEPMKEITTSNNKKSYTPKKEAKKEVVEVSEEEVEIAIVETLAVKIKEDEKMTKSSTAKETLVGETTEPIEEEPKQKSPSMWIIIGAVALGVGAFFLKKK